MNLKKHMCFKCWRVFRGALAVLALICVCSGTSVSAQTTTNHWLSLKDLLNKWEKTPLNEILAAATNNDLTAEHYMGYCYAEGLRTDQNVGMAVFWYERALSGGYVPSANNLGLMYQRGLLGSVDWGKAIYYYTYAADRGIATAQANLGFAYQGLGRQLEAFEAFRKAAKEGSLNGMTQLYFCYHDGNGVTVDRDKAMQWLTKSAQGGDPYAQCLLGYSCEFPDWQTNVNGQMYFMPNLHQALHWYRLSADQGWAGGQYHLGQLY